LGTDDASGGFQKSASANDVVSRLLSISKAPMNRLYVPKVKRKFIKLKKSLSANPSISSYLNIDELELALSSIKPGKSASSRIPELRTGEKIMDCQQQTYRDRPNVPNLSSF
jgi:hypothetical protein